MKRAVFLVLFFFFLGQAFAAPPARTPYGKRAEVREFVRAMVRQHGFIERELRYLFARARLEPAILAAIVPPRDAKARSWQEYRARFVNDGRIAEGAEFWRRHAPELARAAQEHGVPEEIIV
ncbi:MAG: lytic murein transglycosylase, partial [Betaproteobacteria bacterium]|nr:lytic murein transglycosylase [Betaproteobacteria bacterium]